MQEECDESLVHILCSWFGCRDFVRSDPREESAPPIVALLGLLGMVIGEQFGVWIQTKKLDVSHAASVCLVGERYDGPRTSAARSIQAREDLPHAKQIFPSKND